jgi:hypothetical protein
MSLSKEQAEELKNDFLEYSGGFGPHEAFDEMTTYVDVNCPPYCTQDELQEFFDEWMKEEEAKPTPSKKVRSKLFLLTYMEDETTYVVRASTEERAKKKWLRDRAEIGAADVEEDGIELEELVFSKHDVASFNFGTSPNPR